MPNTREIDLLSKLDLTFTQKDWDKLLKLLNPKLFGTVESGESIAFQIVAKVAQILTATGYKLPETVTISCLKCLGNSCLNGYKHKEYSFTNIEHGKYCHQLYSILAQNDQNLDVSNSYPHATHFPYEGVVEWTSDYIILWDSDIQHSEKQLEILRLSIQFLCNFFTFACEELNFPDEYNAHRCLNASKLKTAIAKFMSCDYAPVARASCAFVHNALNELPESYFTEVERKDVIAQIFKPLKRGFQSAREALFFLLCHTNILEHAYEDLSIEDKLYLLEIIYNETMEVIYQSKKENGLGRETIAYLSERFCKESDLILKTVNTYLNGLEPTEIIILLDILGLLTSENLEEYNFLKENKSLLINCTYLLKSVHTIGKETNNYFTPMQKLSDVAPAAQGITIDNTLTANQNTAENEEAKINTNREKLSHHPAFGFKAGLIRVIGNMSYRNKTCQNLLREIDAIPLLLDCCNIDGRNPLIMQWAILALRNLCEDNPENQEVVRNCTRVGIVENDVLKEMGLTLHEEEDGKKIGIVPLPRNQEKK